MLWQHLGECGYQDYHLEYIWQQIEDAVIKTILVALPEMRKEFHEMETISAYNTYKILGVVLLSSILFWIMHPTTLVGCVIQNLFILTLRL